MAATYLTDSEMFEPYPALHRFAEIKEQQAKLFEEANNIYEDVVKRALERCHLIEPYLEKYPELDRQHINSMPNRDMVTYIIWLTRWSGRLRHFYEPEELNQLLNSIHRNDWSGVYGQDPEYCVLRFDNDDYSPLYIPLKFVMLEDSELPAYLDNLVEGAVKEHREYLREWEEQKAARERKELEKLLEKYGMPEDR